jgi:hypothetical protein
MKRERGRRQPKAISDLACRQAVWAFLDQQAENLEPGLLGQRAKRRNRG